MNAKRLSSLLILVVAIIAAPLLWRYFNPAPLPPTQVGNGAPQQPRAGAGERRGVMAPPPVQVASTQSASVPYYLSGLGTVTAANTVTIRSRVNGELMALHFQEGQQVKAGDVLAEIDPRPFQVELTQAQGQLARDRALLANARQDLSRYQQLVKTNLISRQELDAQMAQVRQAEGTLKADEGAVASAALQLAYSKITAPISGRVGLKLVDAGNYITSGDANGLVVITQTHPIDALFTVPEGEIATILNARKSTQPPIVEAWDRANQNKLAQGALLSMDNQIDVTTGTIKLKARFENLDDALFPNQFVNIRLKVDTLQNAVLAPTAAVQMGNEGRFVWIVNDKRAISKRQVTTGIQYGQHIVISAGLDAGVQVVTDGIDRLTEGANVEILPSAGTEKTPVAGGEKP